MSAQKINPSTTAAPAGSYSHGVVAPGSGQWLYVAGQIGVLPNGTLADGFAPQAKAAWQNLIQVLNAAGMDARDLIKVTTYLVNAEHLKELNAVRSVFLGSERPASTLVVVQALAKPEWLFEVEAVAWCA